MRVAIIGGGAAGCFAAIHLKRMLSAAEVLLYEAAPKILTKVALTGGGRCNLTNSFVEVRSMESVYPRGSRLMKRLFKEFDHRAAFHWFEHEGVRLTIQDDQCVFPVSQRAMQIVDTLTEAMRRAGVIVKTSHRVSKIEFSADEDNIFTLNFSDGRFLPERFDCVLATTGGSPHKDGLKMYTDLGIAIEQPLPSLFSFCIPDKSLTSLMGIVVEGASIRLVGTKVRAEGALLLTHWGVSGPAVLKLSSYAARLLAETDYKAQISINWLGAENEETAMDLLEDLAKSHPQKMLSSVYPEVFNSRLWLHLLQRCGLTPERRWSELGRKGYNKLTATLTDDVYSVAGKNRFKEEFVTCGGIALSEVDSRTLESRDLPGLFFAGEVLDVDAVTGGFNLQAAWTMGYVAAKSIIARLSN